MRAPDRHPTLVGIPAQQGVTHPRHPHWIVDAVRARNSQLARENAELKARVHELESVIAIARRTNHQTPRPV